jgi:hypothetical protein
VKYLKLYNGDMVYFVWSRDGKFKINLVKYKFQFSLTHWFLEDNVFLANRHIHRGIFCTVCHKTIGRNMRVCCNNSLYKSAMYCRWLLQAYCVLPTAYCLLHTAYCILPTAYCILHTAYCILPTAYCILPTAYCLLHTAYFILHTAYCILHTAYCILHTAYSIRNSESTRAAVRNNSIMEMTAWIFLKESLKC